MECLHGRKDKSGNIHSAQTEDFLRTSDGVLFHGCYWGLQAQIAVDDVHTNDDGVSLVEDCHWSENAGEYSKHLAFLFLQLLQLFHVLGEVVEKVVNDLSCEDFDAHL